MIRDMFVSGVAMVFALALTVVAIPFVMLFGLIFLTTLVGVLFVQIYRGILTEME